MTVYVTPNFSGLRDGTLNVAYVCSCGWTTDREGVCCGGVLDAVRGHLVDEHGAELGAGRCERCATPTNAFRAHIPELGQDVWLCERHAPKIPVVVDQLEETAP